MTHAATIEAMKAWCLDNYTNGADTMAECWSDSDYAELFTFEGEDSSSGQIYTDGGNYYPTVFNCKWTPNTTAGA